MDPNIAVELTTARHAEPLHTVDRRTASLPATPRPTLRPAVRTLSRRALEITQRLRRRGGQLVAPGSPRGSTFEPCC